MNYFLSPSSGFVQDQSINHVRYKCRLAPAEFIAVHDNGEKITGPESFDIQKRAYEDQLRFTLIIGDEEESGAHTVKRTVFDERKFAEVQAYSNSGLQQDLELELPGGERIPCALVHLEPGNSVDPVIRLTVAFSLPHRAQRDYTLVCNDNIFNNGKMKFRFSKEIFERIPQLDI